MTVSVSPRMAVATMTSSSVKARRTSVRISECPPVIAVGRSLVVEGEDEGYGTVLHGHLPRQGRHDEGEGVARVLRQADPHLDVRRLGLSAGPEVQIGPAGDARQVVVQRLDLSERDAAVDRARPLR